MKQTKEILAVNIDDHDKRIRVQYCTDNTCKRCGIGCSNLNVNAIYSVDSNENYYIYLMEYCPSCFGLSIAEYRVYPGLCNNPVDITGEHPTHFPARVAQTNFDRHIVKMSPLFVEFYHQSETAQQQGCADICGMGYRKALEFLVKDYLIHEAPNEQSQIEGLSLSNAIQRINDPRVKTLAKASSWLGNDECHYIRKHTSHDVEDMKRFIFALVNFLVSELTFEEAAAFTNPADN